MADGHRGKGKVPPLSDLVTRGQPRAPAAPATLPPRQLAHAVPSVQNVLRPDVCSSSRSWLRCHRLSVASPDTSPAPSPTFLPPLLGVLPPEQSTLAHSRLSINAE